MISKILDIVYSIYFNLKYLPFKVAKKFPLIVNRHLDIRMLSKGNIIINNNQLSIGMIHLGIDRGSFRLAKKVSTIYIEKNCRLVFNGRSIIDGGFSIAINHGGEINIGKNVHLNANNIVINGPKCIFIGKNCWIGAKTTIMKGVSLCKNIIVPYGSIITKKCEEPYCIFGGMPNRVLKTNIARKDKI